MLRTIFLILISIVMSCADWSLFWNYFTYSIGLPDVGNPEITRAPLRLCEDL